MKQKYGLIGYPLAHSFSKRYFTEKFSNEEIAAVYELYPIEDIKLLPHLLESEPLLLGLNVTIPYKKSVLPFLESLSAEARAIGAVNTISIQRDKEGLKLKGWNTDAPAFESEILDFTDSRVGNALVLGNGGAANSACYVLRKLGWKVTQASRKILPENESAILYTSINNSLLQETDLIVNTTPVGMHPLEDAIPEIPMEFITSKHLIFDMIYNPEITRFMAAGLSKGAKIRNGLGMLHKQADLAWLIWQGNNQAKK